MFNQNITTFDKSTFLSKVYGLMGISLLISLISAYYGSTTGLAKSLILAGGGRAVLVGVIILIAEFAMIYLVRKTALQNPALGTLSLGIFSILDGLTMSTIFIAYPVGLIADAFFVSAVVFATMSLIGLKAKKELTWGRQLFGALIALIVVDFIQLFIFNSLMMLIFSSIGVVLFSLWTIYDSQKIMELGEQSGGSNAVVIMGALEMYLDFINLFIDILQILGYFNNNN